MGCCESTPEVPEEIIPDPEGPCHFIVQSCSMFNKDYEVFRDEVDQSQRWLFLNKEGKGNSGKAYIDLENYVRTDEANPKKGEVLWRAKYDEHPDFKQQYGDSDSSSDGFSSDGFRPSRRKLQMKWKLNTKATITSIKYPGQEFKIKVKAKGRAQRVIRFKRDEEGKLVKTYHDTETVKKVSYKIKNNVSGDTVDNFKIKGLSRGGELKWKNAAFKASLEGGFFSRGNTDIYTMGGVDPGFCLLMAHICSTEFGPSEIKGDLHPNWRHYDGWDSDGFGSNSGSD
mmetsp:Transcript_1356/g.3157  ORF Transcript_1356/g.3157 Transcript_1356/m.3157 type:complete len:284 (+) Transcript_1356:72-923(+)|eukprot:CAMPEP_0197583678 /NCGR_PEP_ID=MMETSP1326-20131121/6521_1 /TAXON_ID=1155430 /ORGANISM="Genus nov. species nov., Strain RCC2288" /LENGTH=283 /DNA_ID=CAMNT_0043147933 /DNA_START=44 /DNA_END=895 /DNA_ORIENTATION=-